jgi:hypothetical protein
MTHLGFIGAAAARPLVLHNARGCERMHADIPAVREETFGPFKVNWHIGGSRDLPGRLTPAWAAPTWRSP